MNRRSFVKNASVAAAGAGVMPEAREKLTFVHHVFFWLKNPDNKEEYDQLLNALKNLGKLSVIQHAHIGKPVVTEFDKPVTDGSYTFSVMLVFASAKDEQTYLVHPEHKAFIDKNKDLWSKVVVYDSTQIV